MKLEYFISKRLFSSKENQENISRPIITIAVVGIALGIAVMIISMAIVTGFKKEIRKKIIGFGSHIQILNFDSNKSYETIPIDKSMGYYSFVQSIKGIKNMQVFATKAGIIKTDNQIQGVVLKGIDRDYDWEFFSSTLFKGDTLDIQDSATTNEILISKYLSNLLNLDLGDEISMFFIQQPPRMRKFKIKGIYETSLEEMDKLFIICDIKHIRKLNNWEDNYISGWEISIENFNELDLKTQEINDLIGYDFFENGSKLKVISIKEKYPQIFDWLNLLDMNVWVILFLMLIVSGINMISGLLVIILERINMIGMLKSFGAENGKIKNIFVYFSGFLVIKGLAWGNGIGILLCLLQYFFGIIKLDPASYYIDIVPINLSLTNILMLNAGTLLIVLLMMLLPSLIISKVNPVRSIKFN